MLPLFKITNFAR